jgi:hypothetical protein
MQSIQCTGVARHDTVWLLQLTAAGQQLTVPLFVDRTAAPESAFASLKIQLCLPSPDIPQSQGGAAFGAKILDAILDLNGIYTNPSARGRYTWRGVFTPYTPGTGTPNPAGTVESQGLVSIPSTLTLKARYISRTNTYRLQGKLVEVGPVIGAPIQIFRATTPKALVAAVSAGKPKGQTRTRRNGVYKTAGHLKPRKRTFFITVAPALAVESNGGCDQGPLPVPCVTATTNDVISNAVSVKVPRRR